MEVPVHLSVAILICTICGTFLVVRHQYSTPVYQLNVYPNPGELLKLAKALEEQSRPPEPKIVYRCLDDEPKIKYSKYASDDLTAVVMGTNDECGNENLLDAIIIVHTTAKNFERRQIIRSYANESITYPYKIKVVFLIGQTLNANTQIELEIENRLHGDTVVGAFLDTYQNLTLKGVMGFRWLSETCRRVPVLIKMDDDVLFDPHKFFDFWKERENAKRTIFCRVWKKAPVQRKGKWKVERALFANETYDFPYCAGFITVVTSDLIKQMYLVGKTTEFFWIDDVFLYGMVPNILKGVEFVQLGKKFVYQKMDKYKKCREKYEDGCPAWGALSSSQSELEEELKILRTPKVEKEKEKVEPKQNHTIKHRRRLLHRLDD